jgi:hypothetical protein
MSELLITFANVLAMFVAAVSLPLGGLTFCAYLYNKFVPPTPLENIKNLAYEMRTGYKRVYSYPVIRRALPGAIASIWLISAWYTGNFL